MGVLAAHRQLISTLLGLAGLLVLVAVLAHRLARRAGGWPVVRRRARHETRATLRAFATPVTRQVQYLRRWRQLGRLLADGTAWPDAERALLSVATRTAGADCRPYAVLLGSGTVGVAFAGRTPPEPDGPWTADEDDPRLWWADRPDLAAEPDGDGTALLVVVGLDDRYREGLLVLLDLVDGPPVTAAVGDRRTARALVQAVAAQLDGRLPEGSVLVSDGVHRSFPGETVDVTWRGARARAATGEPAVAVCAGLPGALETSPPAWPGRALLLVLGEPRGYARILDTDRIGRVRVAGTNLTADLSALPRVVAGLVGTLPPAVPPGGPVSATPPRVILDEPDSALAVSALEPPEETTPARPRTERKPFPAPGSGGPPTRGATQLPEPGGDTAGAIAAPRPVGRGGFQPLPRPDTGGDAEPGGGDTGVSAAREPAPRSDAAEAGAP